MLKEKRLLEFQEVEPSDQFDIRKIRGVQRKLLDLSDGKVVLPVLEARW